VSNWTIPINISFSILCLFWLLPTFWRLSRDVRPYYYDKIKLFTLVELKVRRNYFISNISLQMWFRCQATIVLTSPLFEKRLEIIQKPFPKLRSRSRLVARRANCEILKNHTCEWKPEQILLILDNFFPGKLIKVYTADYNQLSWRIFWHKMSVRRIEVI